MIRYHANYMGPINKAWLEENGDDWAGGRIDVSGTNEPFGIELSLPIMKSTDYSRFSEWLWRISTTDLWSLDQLVELYEKDNPKITWWKK